jgi:hypothetical protein
VHGHDGSGVASIATVYDVIGLWEFDRDVDVAVAARVAIEQLEAPDLEALLISTEGDVITLRVLEGTISDPESVLYVARRGLYAIARAEERPSSVGAAPRMLLTLRAWPDVDE